MNRRELLKHAIPIAALAPVAMAVGISRYNLEPAGHFLFVVNLEKEDIDTLMECGNDPVPLMPKGSKGGWIIGVYGNPDEAMKIFRLDHPDAEQIMGRPPDIKA